MKRMKKLVSVLIMMALAVTMAIGVSAAAIIIPEKDTHTYEIYQIFTGEYYTGVDENGKEIESLKEMKWGQNSMGEAGTSVDEDTLNELDKFSTWSLSNNESIENIMKFADFAKNNAVGTIAGGKRYDLPDGYYLLKDVDLSDKEGEAYSTYILQLVGGMDTEITRKGDAPTSEKKVKDINDSTSDGETVWQDSADHDLNDTINYKLTANLPDNVSSYNEYTLKFVDDLSKGLTIDLATPSVIYLNDTRIDEMIPAPSSKVSSYEDGAVYEWDLGDVKNKYGVTNNDVITIEYTATLNENAVVGEKGNPNKMHIEYSNNPNYDGQGETGKTPDDTVIVFTYDLIVDKVDQDKNPLPDAKFILEKYTYSKDEDGNDVYQWVEVKRDYIVSDDKTVFTWSKIDDGTYRITEVEPPAGYNAIKPIYFKVTADHEIEADDPQLKELKGIVLTEALEETDEMFDVGGKNASLMKTIENRKGSTLPETGGMGTRILYILGSVLVLGAGILLITRRRMAAK